MRISILLACIYLAMSACLGEENADKIVSEYEAGTKQAKADFDAKMKELKDATIAKLREEVKTLAGKGELNAAQRVSEMLKSIEQEATKTAVAQGTGQKTESPKEPQGIAAKKAEDESKIRPIPPGPKINATFYAKAFDTFSIYVNGQRLLAGSDTLVKKVATIAVGDIITIKTSKRLDIGDGYGVACVILAGNNTAVTTNMNGWKCYKPKNDAIWYQPDQIDGIGEVQAGKQSVKEGVSNAANVDCDSIWGVGQEKLSYLYLQVTKDSFIPAK